MAYTTDSKSVALTSLRVQIPPPPQSKRKTMKITPNVKVISYTLELSEEQLRTIALVLDYVALDTTHCISEVIEGCVGLFGYPKLGTVEFDTHSDPKTTMIRIRGDVKDHFEKKAS